MANKLVTFVKEAKVELSKVNWLTRKQTINYTLLVIGISIAVSVFLGNLDFVFETLVRKFIIR